MYLRRRPRCGCRPRSALRSRPDRAHRVADGTAATIGPASCGGYYRQEPGRRGPRTRPTSAARAPRKAIVSPAANTSSLPYNAQRILDFEKALLVDRKAGLRQPARCGGLRRPEDLVGLDRGTTGKDQPSRLDADDGRCRNDRNPARRQDGTEAHAKRGWKGRQESLGIGDQHERQTRGLESGLRNFVAQPSFDRQQQLDTAGPRTNQRQRVPPVALEGSRQERLEMLEKTIDRLDRDGVLVRAAECLRVGGRADIEREQIVRHWRAIPAEHACRSRSRSTTSS